MPCLSTLRRRSPTGGARSHGLPICQPQLLWFAHFSQLQPIHQKPSDKSSSQHVNKTSPKMEPCGTPKGQVFTDVSAQEPEVWHHLHLAPVYGDGLNVQFP
ncbi:hypothetical protein XENORESO_013954 [Xenotaenia resolanae]|uniref:Uncharacterized protein n=1 Tax=Xenotaenia resolanae TaxID=208358 RepID=A0ABV0WG05_9TELE